MRIDWFTAAAQLVNFVVLVLLLRRFLYRPITRAMREREERVTARLREAEQREAAAAEHARALEAEHTALSDRRQVLLERARAEAQAQREELIARARNEARELHAKLGHEVEGERERFAQQLRDESARWAAAALRRALADLADAPLEDLLVRRFLRDMAELKDEALEALEAGAEGEPLRVHTSFALSKRQRDAVHAALAERLSGRELRLQYAESPELVCGIELRTPGLRLAWSVDDYLSDFEDRLADALRAPLADRARMSRGASREGPADDADASTRE